MRNAIWRPGLTIVEILVALVVLGTGVLGTLAVQARAIRAQRDAQHLALAASRLTSINDSLRAIPCASIVGGTETARGFAIGWRATQQVASLTVEFSVATARGNTFTTSTIVPCLP